MPIVGHVNNYSSGDTQYMSPQTGWTDISGLPFPLYDEYQVRSESGDEQYGIRLGVLGGGGYDKCKMTLNNADTVTFSDLHGTVTYRDNTGLHTLEEPAEIDNVTEVETQDDTSRVDISNIDEKSAFSGEND